jgi:hypothetical protein
MTSTFTLTTRNCRDSRSAARDGAIITVDGYAWNDSTGLTLMALYYKLPIKRGNDSVWIVDDIALKKGKAATVNAECVKGFSDATGISPNDAEHIIYEHAIKSLHAYEVLRAQEDEVEDGAFEWPDVLAATTVDATGNLIDANADDVDAEPDVVEITITDTVSLASMPSCLPDHKAMAGIQTNLLRHQYAKALNGHNASVGGLTIKIDVVVMADADQDIGSDPLVSIVGHIDDEPQFRRNLLARLPSKTLILGIANEVASQMATLMPMAA